MMELLRSSDDCCASYDCRKRQVMRLLRSRYGVRKNDRQPQAPISSLRRSRI